MKMFTKSKFVESIEASNNSQHNSLSSTISSSPEHEQKSASGTVPIIQEEAVSSTGIRDQSEFASQHSENDIAQVDDAGTIGELTEHVINSTTVEELLDLPRQRLLAEQYWNVTCRKHAELPNPKDVRELKNILFTPTGNSKSLKLIQESVSREDDGLYTALSTGSKNLNRLLERIWHESGSENPWITGEEPILLPVRDNSSGQLQSDRNERKDQSIITVFRHPRCVKVDAEKNFGQYMAEGDLIIDIASVFFQHHPLFTAEHVVAQSFLVAFKNYSDLFKKNWSERCCRKLVAIRESLRHSMSAIMSADPDDYSQKDRLEKRAAKYRRDMSKLRKERDNAFANENNATEKVLGIWKLLKQVRQHQGFSSTSVHLKIIRMETDREQDFHNLEKDMQEEFEDLKDAFEINYRNEIERYKKKLKKWRSIPAEKPLEDDENSEVLSITEKRPEEPVPFDEMKTVDEIQRRFRRLRRIPGEPKLLLEQGSVPITPTDELVQNSIEVKRRKEMSRMKYNLRIYVDMKLTQDPKSLDQDFIVNFNEIIRIPSKGTEENLHVEIRENSNKIQLIEIPLPHSTVLFETSTWNELKFIGEHKKPIRSKYGSVGADVQFSILSETQDGLPLSGQINMRLGWSSVAEKSSIIGSVDASISLISHQDSLPDPNDPAASSKVPEVKECHLPEDFPDEVTEFCSWSEIQGSNRLRLIFLRDQGIPEFKNVRMIPANDSEILPEIFNEYDARLQKRSINRTNQLAEEGSEALRAKDMDGNELNDRLIPIKELRRNLLESFENSIKQITYDQVVVEDQIPDIGTLGLNIFSYLFQVKRPLKPQRKERKRIQTSHLINTSVSIIVNVVRGINLPLRKDSTGQVPSTESITGVNVKRGGSNTWIPGVVNPFVEVWFGKNVNRTTTSHGSDPTWNEELQIPLINEKDDSESILEKLEEDIYFQVYDEVAIDLLEDERRRDTDIHQRLQKRWLGSIRIPFATLYRTGRIEGTFPLNIPIILLGYENKSSSDVTEAYLTVFITLQPSITPPSNHPQDPVAGTGETKEMLEHVQAWTKQLQLKGDGLWKPFVLTPMGETVLACRFLTPIKPPVYMINPDATVLENMIALASYVSLFPCLRDASLGISQYALWFTPDVFLSTPGGSSEDHAILLACFFLDLGISTYIVQGESYPEGSTSFVLTTSKGGGEGSHLPKTPLLWDPCFGTHVQVNHTYSPLNKVWTIIGTYNMWGNVRGHQKSYSLDWNFEKSRDWLALFPKGIPETKIPRLSFGELKLIDENEDEAHRLGQKIERQLRESFMKWRESTRTIWNRYSSTKLRSLLPILEEKRSSSMSVTSSTSIQNEFEESLREISKTFEMIGFPLHQSFSTFGSVSSAVYSTGLHTIDIPNIQFALAAFAKSYPASTYSIWIYIAALHPHRLIDFSSAMTAQNSSVKNWSTVKRQQIYTFGKP